MGAAAAEVHNVSGSREPPRGGTTGSVNTAGGVAGSGRLWAGWYRSPRCSLRGSAAAPTSCGQRHANRLRLRRGPLGRAGPRARTQSVPVWGLRTRLRTPRSALCTTAPAAVVARGGTHSAGPLRWVTAAHAARYRRRRRRWPRVDSEAAPSSNDCRRIASWPSGWPSQVLRRVGSGPRDAWRGDGWTRAGLLRVGRRSFSEKTSGTCVLVRTIVVPTNFYLV